MSKRIRILAAGILAGAIIFLSVPIRLHAMANPTGAGLTEFATVAMQEKWGYVYGTYGQEITPRIIEYKSGQYPDMYGSTLRDGRTVYEHALKWVGGRAADCSGLIKAYLWWQEEKGAPRYDKESDESANGIYKRATVKGPIESIPRTHGVLVWRKGHIGIYIGNGEVIESRGVMHGVVKTKLADRKWSGWCLYPQVKYPTAGWVTVGSGIFYYRDGQYVVGEQVIDGKKWVFGEDGVLQPGQHAPPLKTDPGSLLLPPGTTGEPLQRGMLNGNVLILQQQLTALGCLTGPVDGEYGPRTEFAVSAVQQRLGLPVTGIADADLQAMFQGGQVPAASPRQQPDALTYGDAGEEVLILQQRLLALKLFKTTPGGHFGPITLQAVKLFQTLNGLPVTGIVGTAEFEMFAREPVQGGRDSMYLYDRGPEVLILQQRLAALGYFGAEPDSHYSAAVAAAVRAFQKQAGLPVNGFADFATQNQLFLASAPSLADKPVLERVSGPLNEKMQE